MKYISTRGGEVVSGLEAVWRGISSEGGLYIPQALPQPLPYQELMGRSLEELMAEFFYRFLPDLSLDDWKALLSHALRSLKEGPESFELPLARVNNYLDRYYLLLADDLPTGSLSDLSGAILRTLLEWTGDKDPRPGRPLVLAMVGEDQAASSLSWAQDLPYLVLMSQNSIRSREIARLPAARDQLLSFSESFDERYREFTRLASDPSFDSQLRDRGFKPVFVGPGHIIEVLTAGALATAIVVAIKENLEELDKIDFVVHKNHLSFLAGLVYASSLQLPLGLVYLGENEPAFLTSLFKSGRTAKPRRRRRRDDEGAAWPVNLERLLFEVTGRDEKRLKEILDQADQADRQLLREEEVNLLNQSVVVGGNDYKRCLRTIRTFYDQTDYLLARETADAVAVWARHVKQKDHVPVCFIQDRSPLTDYVSSGRALFGDKAPRHDREAAITMLAEEAGIPAWQSLDQEEAPPIQALEGPLDLAIVNWLDKEENHGF